MRDVDLVKDFQICALEELLKYSDTLMHKAMNIGGFLVHKYEIVAEFEDDEILNKFVEGFNRQGLCVPALGIVFFVYCAISL